MWRTVSEVWSLRLTVACGDCGRADRTVMFFICFVQKGGAGSCCFQDSTLSFLCASFTHNFVTTSLSHTSLSHTIFHTQLCHTLSRTVFYIRLCHTQLFTYNLFYLSILHQFLCLSFPVPLQHMLLIILRKKLACGVIRSFNFEKRFGTPIFGNLDRLFGRNVWDTPWG